MSTIRIRGARPYGEAPTDLYVRDGYVYYRTRPIGRHFDPSFAPGEGNIGVNLVPIGYSGVEHILLGMDHLLFVLGLLLIVQVSVSP